MLNSSAKLRIAIALTGDTTFGSVLDTVDWLLKRPENPFNQQDHNTVTDIFLGKITKPSIQDILQPDFQFNHNDISDYKYNPDHYHFYYKLLLKHLKKEK